MATTNRRERVVMLKLNDCELELLRAAAAREGFRTSDWLRFQIRQAREREQQRLAQ